MYETLRIWGPVTSIPKYNKDGPQPLTIQGKSYVIPARTCVVANIGALHWDPAHWGPDSLEFHPKRFIKSKTGKLQDEELELPGGQFVPWASGPRVCPGKKFSQVEFVAVVARLFLKHRVEPARKDGETQEMSLKRVKDCLMDSGITVTLRMRNPDRAQLAWKEKL